MPVIRRPLQIVPKGLIFINSPAYSIPIPATMFESGTISYLEISQQAFNRMTANSCKRRSWLTICKQMSFITRTALFR